MKLTGTASLLFVLLFFFGSSFHSQAQLVNQNRLLREHKPQWLWLYHTHPVNLEMKFRKPFFRPDTSLNKLKTGLVVGGSLLTFTGALVVLDQYWYKGYPQSAFHFFNDGGEWLQMDKVGHAFNSYYISRWSVNMYRWAGMKELPAILLGGMNGTFLMLSVEMLDGFSTQWGFSWYDMLANFSGSALVISQELAWKEQRITLKMSSSPVGYPAGLKDRTGKLFGTSVPEQVVKDYNGLTIWASVSVASFIKGNPKFPKWLCVSIGYGGEGMLGARENKWNADGKGDHVTAPPSQVVDRTDIRRYRQFYLSLDIDFTKIKTKSPAVRTLLNALNIIKVPFPTFEFNPVDKVRFHPLYF